MTKQTERMLKTLSSGIDLTRPSYSSINLVMTVPIEQEVRNLKAVIVNLINILLEED